MSFLSDTFYKIGARVSLEGTIAKHWCEPAIISVNSGSSIDNNAEKDIYDDGKQTKFSKFFKGQKENPNQESEENIDAARDIGDADLEQDSEETNVDQNPKKEEATKGSEEKNEANQEPEEKNETKQESQVKNNSKQESGETEAEDIPVAAMSDSNLFGSNKAAEEDEKKDKEFVEPDFSSFVEGIVFTDPVQAFQGRNPEIDRFFESMHNRTGFVSNPAQDDTTLMYNPPTPRHKNELPHQPTVVKEKPKKAEADKVDIDLDAVTPPETEAKPIPVETDIIDPKPSISYTVEPPKPIFDNSEIYRIYDKKEDLLRSIEKIAISQGAQIQYVEITGDVDKHHSGLLCVQTYVDGNFNHFKSFIIDLGVVIDRREKLWPTMMCVEDANAAYELKVNGPEKNGKKVLNEKLLIDIFRGGIAALRPKDNMYTSDFLALNRLVALITTNNIKSKDDKIELRNRLIKAMNAGVFTAALNNDPATRFRLKYFNSVNDFALTSEGVPFRYRSNVFPSKVQEIVFSNGKTTLSVI